MSLLPHSHVVDFYEKDTELAARVASYLCETLRQGGTAVLIATREHRPLYAEALRRAGVDVEWCRASGRLIEADARTLLESFLVDGEIDPDRFDEAVGAIIRSARTAGDLRVVGEMVQLLWARGEVLAALDLETEWNRLVAENGVPLYCCYGIEGFEDDVDALVQIRDLHHGVVSSPTVLHWAACRSSETFPPELASPAAARRFVAGVLGDWGICEGTEAVNLVVSELANNALLHAKTPFEVTVSLCPGKLRVTVRDSSPIAPVQRAAAETETSGRGLAIVAACAESWGIESDADGKNVWAEVDLPDT